MPILKRVLRVTLNFDQLSGQSNIGKVVLTEDLNLRVNIEKNVLALQNSATVEVSNLGQTLRQDMTTQFTAYQKRQSASGNAQLAWVGMQIEAGYIDSKGNVKTSVIFKGEVVQLDNSEAPPNISVRIRAYTRQQDKTKFVTDPAPSNSTYEQYVNWAAGQMGITANLQGLSDRLKGASVQNAAMSRYTASALLWDIQDYYKPDVAAFVDDDVLYVMDRNAVINPQEIVAIDQFVGVPGWYDWGVELKVLFNTAIKVAHAVDLTSVINPGINHKYVITRLEYDLASRDTPFYIKAQAAPPAQ